MVLRREHALSGSQSEPHRGARGGRPRRVTALVVLALTSWLAAGALACGGADGGAATGPEPEPPAPSIAADGSAAGTDITGRIAWAEPCDGSPTNGAAPTLAFLVEDGRGAYGDKASVTATTETRWYETSGDELRELKGAPASTALVGRNAAVAFTGPVAESYPVQATAGWVVLLPAAD